MVQWLKLHNSNAGGHRLDAGPETKIPHAPWPKKPTTGTLSKNSYSKLARVPPDRQPKQVLVKVFIYEYFTKKKKKKKIASMY